MNSLRSAWTPLLAGLPKTHRQAKGGTEARPNQPFAVRDILSIELVQKTGQIRVAGLALEVMTGRVFGPESFKGGEESACFRALRRCDFTIVPKVGVQHRSLIAENPE